MLDNAAPRQRGARADALPAVHQQRCMAATLPGGIYHHHKGSSLDPIPGGAKVRCFSTGTGTLLPLFTMLISLSL